MRKRITRETREISGSRPDVRSAGLFYSLLNYPKHPMAVKPQGRGNPVPLDGTHFPQTSIARVSPLCSEFRWSTDCFALDYPENRTAARLVLQQRRHNSPWQRAPGPTIRILVNLTCCSTTTEPGNHPAPARIIYSAPHRFQEFFRARQERAALRFSNFIRDYPHYPILGHVGIIRTPF